MAVDLTDLLDAIKTEVSPPGSDLFPNATDDEWVINLQNAFWEGRLFGFFEGFVEADQEITPTVGDDDLDRVQQQLIVLFAGARILRNELRNLNTSFRAKAGPVEFEQQKSANVLKDLLADIRGRIVYLVQGLGADQVYYIDAVIGRTESIDYGGSYFTSGSNLRSTYGW